MKGLSEAPSERRLIGAVADDKRFHDDRRLIKAMAPFEHESPVSRLWIADAIAQIEGEVTVLQMAYDHTPAMSERIVTTALVRIANRLECLRALIEDVPNGS